MELCKEFASMAKSVGPVYVFDEQTALDLIRRAREEDVAISGIEMVRPIDIDDFQSLGGSRLTRKKRRTSWGDARSFVEMLAGRGLYFQVAFESAWSTKLARFRASMQMAVRDGTSSPPR